MQWTRRLSSRTLRLLGLAVVLTACSTPLPALQSSLRVGEVQVASAQSPTAMPTPLIDPFDSNLQEPTRTPTPDAFSTPHPPEYYYTPTPLPFTKIVDETEGLRDNQVWVFIIRRADGSHEKYLLPIADIPRDSNQHYKEFRDNLLQPGPDDIVTFEGSPGYFGRNPADPAERAALWATPTPLPGVEQTPAAQAQSVTQQEQTLSLPFVISDSRDE